MMQLKQERKMPESLEILENGSVIIFDLVTKENIEC